MKELLRLAGYLRPYMSRMIGAAVMLAVSGTLMAVAISAVKPLVNNVFNPAGQLGTPGESATGAPDILSVIRGWLPVEQLGDWATKNYVLVPVILVVVFFIRGVFANLCHR